MAETKKAVDPVVVEGVTVHLGDKFSYRDVPDDGKGFPIYAFTAVDQKWHTVAYRKSKSAAKQFRRTLSNTAYDMMYQANGWTLY